MNCDYERLSDLYPLHAAGLGNKKEVTTNLTKENATLLIAEMSGKQAPERFNHFAVIVTAGMHQPVEE
ncbi:MAG: hypothetical protein JO232_06170 [Verrucomicrobia bacterium]|nr:hypothetical protein [Verrucomicrobiota bacterium]